MIQEMEKKLLGLFTFYVFTEPNSGCWIWMGPTKPPENNYGKFRGRNAHRVIYELLVEKLPRYLVLHHICENKICVNPEHLRPMSTQENTALIKRKWATHCIYGHEYTEENSRWSYRGDGRLKRQCANCERKRDNLRYKLGYRR